MAIGNLIYSTSSTTIVSGDSIEASDFERSTNLQVDNTSGNINISGGINTSGISTFGARINVTGNVTLSGNVNASGITNSGTASLGAVGSVKITGGSNGEVLTTDGSGNLSWAVAPSLGVNQTWQDVSGSRSSATWYQNTTGKPIYLSIWIAVAGTGLVYVGPSTSSYVSITQDDGDSGEWSHWTGVIPIDNYYQLPNGPINSWCELR